MRSGVSVEEALTEAKRLEAGWQEAGFDQVALETAARQGFSNGAFEESDEEGDSVVDEFYPEAEGQTGCVVSRPSEKMSAAPNLIDKLEVQASKLVRNVS